MMDGNVVEGPCSECEPDGVAGSVWVVSVGPYREETPEAAFPSYEAARAWVAESYPDWKAEGPEPAHFFEGRFAGAVISSVGLNPPAIDPPTRDQKEEDAAFFGAVCSTVALGTRPIEYLSTTDLEPTTGPLPFLGPSK